jgi:hypothetical protein
VEFFIKSWNILSKDSAITYFPKVAIIGDRIPDELQKFDKHLILISQTNFKSSFVAQNIRLFLPGFSQADYGFTSDVDMLPSSTRMFDYGIERLENDGEFLILRDVLEFGQFPICYALARPNKWRELFGPNSEVPDVDKFLNQVAQKYDPNSLYTGVHGGEGWSIDQEYLFWKVKSVVDPKSLVLVNDCQSRHRRLDRAHHKFPINWIVAPLTLISFFTDYHIHHPISRNLKFLEFYLLLLRIQALLRRRYVPHNIR